MRTATVLTIFAVFAAQVFGQNNGAPVYAQPIPMPSDRDQDSYAIYSQLLKSGPIEWRDAKRTQWLIEDATSAVPLGVPCDPKTRFNTVTTNPHETVQPPQERQAEWKEVLADYDQHCHDVIHLDGRSFRTDLPVRLLNADDKHLLMKDPQRPPAEFADGAGLHRFSEVFFNPNHALALVEQGIWCGGLCGNWEWVVLEHKEGRWQMLPWMRMVKFS